MARVGAIAAMSLAATLMLLSAAVGSLAISTPTGPTIVSGRTITIDPGPDATSWAAVIRLRSDRAMTVTVLPSSLKRTNSDPDLPTSSPSAPTPSGDLEAGCDVSTECLSAATVTVAPTEITLVPNVTAQVQVSIAGPLRRGTYDGFLRLESLVVPIASDAPAATVRPKPGATPIPTPKDPPPAPVPVTIRLRLVVRASAPVGLPSGQESVSAVRFRHDLPFEDFLASWLLSPAEQSSVVEFDLENLGSDPTIVVGAPGLIGQDTGTRLVPPAVDLSGASRSAPARIAPGRSGPLALELSMASITPDHYVGTLELSHESSTVQSIPVDLTIRGGPLVPTLLILAGLILGWLLRLLIGRGFPLAQLRDKFRRLERERIQMNADDQVRLVPYVQAFRSALNKLDQDAASAADAALESAQASLTGLRSLLALHPNADPTEVGIIQRLVEDGITADAASHLAALRTASAVAAPPPVVAPGPAGPAGAAVPSPAGPPTEDARASARGRPLSLAYVILVLAAGVAVLYLFTTPSALNFEPSASLGPIIGGLVLTIVIYQFRAQIGRVLRRAATAIRDNAVGFFAFARWPYRLALLIALTIAGLRQLYVAGGAGQISSHIDPIAIYLFWGVATDVVSRAVTNVGKPSGE